MTTPPILPAQQISLLDIYTKQIEMGSDLRTLKEMLPDHENRIRAVEGQIPPHLEERLGALETTKAKMFGLAAAVSVIASAGGTWLGLIIAHH